MTDQEQAEAKAQAEAAAAAAAKEKSEKEKRESGETDTDKDDKDKEPMIPKHRFDEAINKVREDAAKEIADLKSRFSEAADLLGGKKAGQEFATEIKAFADKYNLTGDFTEDLLSLSTARAKKELQAELQPLKAHQAKAYLDQEFLTLEREVPEAKDMSKEDRDELTKMALEKKYHNVPLTDLWKIKNFGKPQGKTKTVEPGRGGGGKAEDGEVDIKSMSPAEFEKFSNELAKKKK